MATNVAWREWVAPGAVIAVIVLVATIVGWQMNGIENRLSYLNEENQSSR
jgi:hypothetical protein